MHIIVLLDEYPWPPTSGNKVVLASEFQAFAELADECIGVAFTSQSGNRDALEPTMPENVAVYRVQRRGLLRSSILHPLMPYQSASRTVPRALMRALSDKVPDVIVANHEWTLPAAVRLKKVFPTARVILRSHNNEGKFMRDFAMNSRGARSLYSHFESLRVQTRYFQRLVRFADSIWLISPADKAAYKRGSVLHTLAPAIASYSATTVAPATIENFRAKTTGFLGALDIPHARSGLIWYLTNVAPQLQIGGHTQKVLIAGRRAPRDFIAQLSQYPFVEYLGEISEPGDFYSRISVFVNPIFSGSGVNIKMLEPAVRGIPVVTTTIGRRGLEDLPSNVSDSAQVFARECLLLLENVERWKEASRAISLNAKAFTALPLKQRIKALLSLTAVSDGVRA